MPTSQRVAHPPHARTDHVWFRANGRWKCCLCGGLVPAGEKPPAYPTPADWTPAGFDLPLTAEERALCPDPKRVA